MYLDCYTHNTLFVYINPSKINYLIKIDLMVIIHDYAIFHNYKHFSIHVHQYVESCFARNLTASVPCL